MKKSLALSFAAILAVTAVGCSNDGAEPTPAAETPAPAESEAPKTETPAEPERAKHTVTALDFRFGDPAPLDGPGLAMINERFNVDYKITQIVNTAYEEKVNVTFASGEIPDFMQLMSGDLTGRYNKFAKQGAFLALDDYIDQYPTLKAVPDFIWDAVRVNGKIYAIPAYAPKFQTTTAIRKDWLDKLGLPVPTSYEELKQVAIAFTKNDPDGNGKDDTYGIAIGNPLNPNYNMGPYWDPQAWYHKDAAGNFVPGLIGEGRKEVVTMFADLYKEKAITSDLAVLNWAETNAEFYSGKAGIFIGTPRGMSQEYMDGLLAIHPDATFVAVDPFPAPDGTQGFTAGKGFGHLTVLSAKLASDPDKIARILEMIDFGRTFYPASEQNGANEPFDWYKGKEGVAYDVVDGKIVMKDNWASDGLSPSTYFVDNVEWPAKDSDIVYADTYQTPQLVDLVAQYEEMYTRINLYANPIIGQESETQNTKGTELDTYVMNEQIKMVMGQRPLSDWDKLVQEYLDQGGAQIIAEYNAGIENKDPKSYYQAP
ncbi:extracellular solute-binding protein [Paenibacillus antri]|uniref:Extracellular solute-binding protein n=1 Tax=Paenibacillus antri TaxID=2582848 RepID=A0A5R9G6P3_9BACL|nr:extracellular solute-binding protein [Paenibacillus antri]TLS52062.1 extracellular solute-binding protein [Paenibacillus antri]